MNALVVGYGSIGSRHVKVLKSLGVDVSVVSRRKVDYEQYWPSVSSAFKDNSFDYMVIASRTNEHHSDLLELFSLGYNSNILIEKPLFEKPYNILLDNTNNIYVGYNFRFNPVFQKLKTIISDQKILSVNAYAGSYLPEWRPNFDYRKSYSAKRNQGGGVLRDLSHELDYLVYMLDGWTHVTSIGGNFSQLEIDSDDIYSIIMKTNQCPIVSIHLNYLDRITNRYVIVNTEKNTIKADFVNKTIKVDNDKESFDYDRDLIYANQHKAVLNNDYSQICSFSEGNNIVDLINKIEEIAASEIPIWLEN